MKMKWKILCLFLVLILDGILCQFLYRSCMKTNEILSLQTGVSGGEQVEAKPIALTFDDGPHDIYTPRLLEGLRKRGVQATFFLLGESLEGKEDIVRQMKSDGHLIGNHGYTHVQMSKESADRALCQIEETNQKIKTITGMCPEYLRPPFGSWNDELESTTDMTVVLWNVDPLDWKVQNTGKVVHHIIKNVESGDIILLHDVFSTSVDAALEVIDTLSKQGYTFVTIDELLVD